jgi:hypothetical protein
MKVLAVWTLLVCLVVPPGFAQDEPAEKEEKKGPNKGTLEITVVSGEKEKTYDTPLKPMSDLRRAVSKFKRLKEGEVSDFSATITLNGTGYQFDDPSDAQNACQALTNASRRLAAVRLGLGDIGEIPSFDPNAAALPAAAAPPTNPAQVKALIQRRVMQALYQQMMPQVTPGRAPSTPRPPSPQQIQQIYAQEIQRARDEGLLPSAPTTGAGTGAGTGAAALPAADPVETAKEEALQMLALAFSKAAPADTPTLGTDEEKPEE